MSFDYVSFREIQLQNQIQTPEVIKMVRNGTISLQNLQRYESPLENLYRNTYKYLEYPQFISDGEREVIRQSQQLNQKYMKEVIQNIPRSYPPNIHG
jgi:hypothetical protein